MVNAADMTETVTVHRKQNTGVSPEPWEQIGNPRRAKIVHISDHGALNEAARFDFLPTHHAFLDADDDFAPEGHGSRMLVRQRDGQNFLILRSAPVGKRGRGGRQKFERLSLSTNETVIV